MAVIPSQDKCVYPNFSTPKSFLWSTPFSVIYVRIMMNDEAKKCDGKNNVRLLKEVSYMEKFFRFVTNLVDSMDGFTLTKQQRAKMELGVDEPELVSDAYQRMRIGCIH
ncbi:hypothetical protein L2E82_24832 [Cichorium intybus]|uniref:Uncharacterized protein n=1 Tax=Cichorium intybus TaxID=13427 RepID=A0ACB9E260_CICIN|nr:hypothetical protein L2E82_24832 [Cichorium intybus]